MLVKVVREYGANFHHNEGDKDQTVSTDNLPFKSDTSQDNTSERISTPRYQTTPNTKDPHDWTGLPIIHDEVFTGLYRLGHATPSSLIGVQPDIAVYAKLLTGGLVPLACTLASDAIYTSFLGDEKAEALLHGHSYTAHPVGTSVALKSLEMLNGLDGPGSHWGVFKDDWRPRDGGLRTDGSDGALNDNADAAQSHHQPLHPTTPQIWSVWSKDFIKALSNNTRRVESVWALGSVLAITLRDPSGGGGYTSTAAIQVRDGLLKGSGDGGDGIHCRVLGNVLYLMTGQMTRAEDVRGWEGSVRGCLER